MKKFLLGFLAAAIMAAVALAVVPLRAAVDVHLVAAGDFGARTATNSVLTRMHDLDPDAALALGDLAYQDVANESAWCDYVKARVGEGFPFQLTAGNHESLDVADGAINNFSACLPNQIPGAVGTYGREYYNDYPAGSASPLVRVISISPSLTYEDGLWSYAQGTSHYNWLSSAIDSGRAKGAKWIVVNSHKPCWSVGVYACPSTKDVYDLLIQKKVDVVLTGHEHSYMRTHQLRSGTAACPTVPANSLDTDCIADSDGNFYAGQGTVFATVGTGGDDERNLNPSDAEAGYFAAMSGLNINPAHGLLDMHFSDTQLTAAFVPTDGSFTDTFALQQGTPPPPVNQAPIAAFTVSGSALSRAFDASGSSDPDGTIASYAWTYGDGSTDTGKTPQHTYAVAGTYAVTLTVTDDKGATGTVAQQVTVTAPATSLAADAFERTIAAGWGTADIGGPWSVTGNTGNYSVSGGDGRMRLASPGSSGLAYLANPQQTGADVTVTLSPDKAQTGGGTYAYVIGRRVSGSADYRALVRFLGTGDVVPSIRKVVGGAETTLVGGSALASKWGVGDEIKVRLQVAGTSPTALKLKVWKKGTTEPAAWQYSATDSTASLQVNGGVGIDGYLSGSVTNAPVSLWVDDLTVNPTP